MKNPLALFVDRAVKSGATEAKIIKAESIVTAAWVRMRCQYGCGGYGSSLCCPPHTPDHRQMKEVIGCYTKAILIHSSGKMTAKNSPSKIIVKLEREIFLAGYYKALGLGSGPCMLCRDCNFEACVHTEKARPSMEACSIDVFATARNNGYPIEVVTDDSCVINRYGLVLIE
jgi:predicted metal-binding protein